MDQSSFLSPPPLAPPNHLVQFYSDDDVFLDWLEDSISIAAESGDAAICVLTKLHSARLARQFELHGRDRTVAIEQGRYIELDADEFVSTVMPEGKFEEGRFSAVFNSVVSNTTNAIERKGCRIRVLGEAVALLWARGNYDDVIQWERSCSALVASSAVSICCAYSTRAFNLQQDNDLFQMICAEHSTVTLSAGLPVGSGEEDEAHVRPELKGVLAQAEQLIKSEASLSNFEWQGPYRAALLETDRHKLFKQLEVAEAAVLTRLQALPPQGNHLSERRQLVDAWTGVQMIKKGKLGFLG